MVAAVGGRHWLEVGPPLFGVRPDSILLVAGDNLDCPSEEQVAKRVQHVRGRLAGIAGSYGLPPSALGRIKVVFTCPWVEWRSGTSQQRVTPLADLRERFARPRDPQRER